ncbi:MAG TPA: hypothetical protein VG246_13125 [Acidimicrobiales bacterium]|jgi:hypothetical protein|nr:hypothetical protein [Acidimicrobiales bacterium]
MICPRCGLALELHWTIALTPDELDQWSKDESNGVLCTLTRAEVVNLIEAEATPKVEETQARRSICSLCGSSKVATPESRYFHAQPDEPFDLDWDGCVKGMGT